MTALIRPATRPHVFGLHFVYVPSIRKWTRAGVRDKVLFLNRGFLTREPGSCQVLTAERQYAKLRAG